MKSGEGGRLRIKGQGPGDDSMLLDDRDYCALNCWLDRNPRGS